MGLPPWCREQLRQRYPHAFGYEGPQYQMVCKDMMALVKGALPDWVYSLNTLRDYLFRPIDGAFSAKTGCLIMFICFDKGTPAPKHLVEHKNRHDTRCKECKKHGDLPWGKTAGPMFFDPECTKNCVNSQRLWFEEGPYLNLTDFDAPLPEWSRYKIDTRNLRAELFPIIMNWVLEYMPPPGKALFTDGLPGQSKIVNDYSADWKNGYHIDSNVAKRHILVPWTMNQLPLDPKTTKYGRVYMMKGIPPCHAFPGGTVLREEVPDMENDILEADNAVFYFSKFFPELRTHVADINDGDAISIGLLRALEDFKGGEPVQEQWLALPYKSKKASVLFEDGQLPRTEWVNLTLLYQKVEASPDFNRNGYQSPVATLIFLLVIADTDFFKGYCFGIGSITEWDEDEKKREKQTKGVWDTFFSRLDMFHHLVQYYPLTKSLTEKRQMVIDEELFAIFTRFCYTNKYEKVAKNGDIVAHCSKFKDERKRFPSDNKILRWARQIGWNLNYWANAFRNIYVDPYERYNEKPYWGYCPDLGIVDDVSPTQKDLDEKHKKHMLKRQRKTTEIQPIPKQRKLDAVRALKGK